MTGMFLALLGGKVQIVSDPYFEYTTLLLPGNGTNGAQNNTFLDSGTANSGSGFTITRNGNTTQGTFSPFSQTGWGNYFSGSSQYLSVANNTGFDFGSSNFTIEAWAYFTSFTSTNGNVVVSKGAYLSVGADFYSLQANSSGVIQFYWQGSLLLAGSTLSANRWYHLAVTRSGNNFTLWVDGASSATATSSTTLSSGGPLIIGSQSYSPGASDRSIYGYVSNLRTVKTIAVYTGAFTPPTSPLTATQSAGTNIAAITGTETSLLTCQSNRFVDNSSTPKTITVTGSPSVQAFSPFNPTSSWSAVTNGGSGYFDGNGDYLTVPDNASLELGSSNFTLETWVYVTAAPSGLTGIFAKGGSPYGGFYLCYNASRVVKLYASTTSSTWNIANDVGAQTLNLNAWNHVAISRNGSSWRIWVNGTSGSSDTVTSSSAVWDTANVWYIGSNTTGAENFTGYMASARFVIGSYVYDPASTTITVPTAPVTNITNTSLLLNFTNAGIYDATSKNDLETVGDAKISTAQSKWGGSSMAFDGTGDYLQTNVATPDLYVFGSGDFTIECWIYLNNTTGLQIIYDGRPAGTQGPQPTLYVTSGQISYYTSNANRIAGSTLSSATWYHIALARSGTSTRLFVNGVQVGSTYTDSTVYTNTALRPQIGQDGSSNGNFFNGYIQDLRVTKGYARYTSNFTAPTAAFPTL